MSLLHSLRSPLLARGIATFSVPPRQGSVTTPAAFLKSIGRGIGDKLSVENWDDLWQQSSADLKEAGLGTRDRRYTLWCMNKYRMGLPIQSFAHEPRPKKTMRGWGPAVQNGKRLRSRAQKALNKAKAQASGS